ncbi:MAG: histidine phosphatase family protein [Bacteroidales bacterium]|nr:histidine phosphatase family protein [Bacteroidales bacterium]
MKKLIFVRHGRAEDPSSEFSDFQRSLTPKGKSIAKLMAKKLSEEENNPGILVTSTAFRALETAIIFGEVLGIKPEKIVPDTNIYYKMSFNYLTDLLSRTENETDTIILFGHNPSFSELPDSLSKEGCDFMPKCGIAGISFNIKKWSEIKLGTGKLEYFLKPEKVL